MTREILRSIAASHVVPAGIATHPGFQSGCYFFRFLLARASAMPPTAISAIRLGSETSTADGPANAQVGTDRISHEYVRLKIRIIIPSLFFSEFADQGQCDAAHCEQRKESWFRDGDRWRSGKSARRQGEYKKRSNAIRGIHIGISLFIFFLPG
ncbi:MAG: hypothetical protein PVJ15_01295 [Gammaproteobacteria bacterium]|jgi:hypothetical protein